MNVRPAAVIRFLLGSSLAFSACDRGEPGRVPEAHVPADVEVVSPAGAPSMTTVPGTVRSTREAEVATRLSGTVRLVHVDVGSTVSAGAALAVLDDVDVRAHVSRAEAELDRAGAYHRRIAALAEDGAATGQELDDALAGMRAAEAGVEVARAQLGYVVIRAPFAGAVSARHVDPGDLAVPGMPVVSLVRPGTVEVEADLPADLATVLGPGSPATVETSDGGSLAVTVRSVSPALDRQSRRARVKLEFDGDDGGLPAPGSFVRVRLQGTGASSLWLPADAIFERGQMTGVYVVQEDRLRIRWIRVGETRPPSADEGGSVEILAGVGLDDLVVRRPSRTLTDGAPVGDVRRSSWTAAGGTS